jgi:hypothetical protein
MDSDSLTETKNWRGRNEDIETSDKLHPLWPQTNDSVRRELQTECILDKTDE